VGIAFVSVPSADLPFTSTWNDLPLRPGMTSLLSFVSFPTSYLLFSKWTLYVSLFQIKAVSAFLDVESIFRFLALC